ncbi:hypothetical protein [Mycobacterium asiaticum]|uniref:hypothetical protein n=1 Tax=Mycobacterium asiaticum TaxID=1790 RepID=UPI0012DB729B|nr:hypothetical protein [Mycobacterium asiaticum]
MTTHQQLFERDPLSHAHLAGQLGDTCPANEVVDLGDCPPYRKNRRTVRNYLNGVTTPGVREPATTSALEWFVDYVSAWLTKDQHLWAGTLCDELGNLGYQLLYPTLTLQIPARNVRPARQECAHTADRQRGN